MITANTVLELFDGHPERWIKGALACDAKDNAVQPGSPDAVRWCLVSAVYRLYTGIYDRRAAIDKLLHATDHLSVVCFNDNPATTFDQIIEVVRKAGV